MHVKTIKISLLVITLLIFVGVLSNVESGMRMGKILDVFAGYDSTGLIDDRGNVFLFGNGSLMKHYTKNDFAGENPSKIVFSQNAVFVITTKGSLYRWGEDPENHGILIALDNTPIEKPKKVDSVFFNGETISDLAASSHHVIAVVASGRAYGWGTNHHGELGTVVGMTRSPVLIDTGILAIKSVYLSDATTALIDTFGHLWMLGDNSKNQLGKSSDQFPSSDTLKKVTASNTEFQFATYIGLGNDFTVGVTNLGRMIAFGNPADGRLGVTSTDEKILPTLVSDEMEYVYQVSAFENGMIALGSTGKMYSFGSNLFGALGKGYEKTQTWTPTQINHPMAVDVIKIATGSNHVVALTKNGTVLTWGSNESIQLGVKGLTSFFADPIPVFTHQKSHFLTFFISLIIFGIVIFNEIIFYYVYYEKERQIFKQESQLAK